MSTKRDSRVAAPTPETPSLIEAVEQFIAAAESYRCASAPLADKFVILESEMMLARNRLRAILLAGAVSHPQPDPSTTLCPQCPQCQRPMTWTATAPVVGARMEWRCFHHADLGTTDGCEVIEVDADGHVSRPVKGPLREGPVAHPVVSPRTET